MEAVDINLFIDHTLFKYEKEKKMLFQAGNRENHVRLDWTDPEQSFFYLKYDCSTGRISPLNDLSKDLPFDQKKVTIPKTVFKFPSFMAMLVNKISHTHKWNLFVADKNVMRRINGRLPEIIINGEKYIVDLRWKELRHRLDSEVRLPLSDFNQVDGGLSYEALFDTRTLSIVNEDSVTDKSEDVMVLQIPNELVLDPIGVARENGMKDTFLLNTFPVLSDLKGTLKPLSTIVKKEAIKEKISSVNKERKRQNRKHR